MLPLMLHQLFPLRRRRRPEHWAYLVPSSPQQNGPSVQHVTPAEATVTGHAVAAEVTVVAVAVTAVVVVVVVVVVTVVVSAAVAVAAVGARLAARVSAGSKGGAPDGPPPDRCAGARQWPEADGYASMLLGRPRCWADERYWRADRVKDDARSSSSSSSMRRNASGTQLPVRPRIVLESDTGFTRARRSTVRSRYTTTDRDMVGAPPSRRSVGGARSGPYAASSGSGIRSYAV